MKNLTTVLLTCFCLVPLTSGLVCHMCTYVGTDPPSGTQTCLDGPGENEIKEFRASNPDELVYCLTTTGIARGNRMVFRSAMLFNKSASEGAHFCRETSANARTCYCDTEKCNNGVAEEYIKPPTTTEQSPIEDVEKTTQGAGDMRLNAALFIASLILLKIIARPSIASFFS